MQFLSTFICPDCGQQNLMQSNKSSFFRCYSCHRHWCIIDMSAMGAVQANGELPPLYGNISVEVIDPNQIGDMGVSL